MFGDAPYALVVVSRGRGEERLFEAVDVRGRADLSVEEVIARWQATREAERRLLDNYAASCLDGPAFPVGSFASPSTWRSNCSSSWIATGLNDWIQTALLVNGVRLKGVREFPLPQLRARPGGGEAARVGDRPENRHRFEGTDTVNDRLCFVVTVEPVSTGELLYLGRIWIDGLDFRQVRMQLEQRAD